MVNGKERQGQIDGGCTDLHPYGVGEVAGSSFCIGPARERGRELKGGRSGCACGLPRHGICQTPMSDPWIHPLRTILGQFLIVAPHVGMVVVELR